MAISSNFREHKGLFVDAQILKALLVPVGHEVLEWQFDDNAAGEKWGNGQRGEKVDLLIFLEVINPEFFRWTRRTILIPNAEWFRDSLRYLMPRLDVVVCKTHDAVKLFTPISKQVYYTGFTSEDLYRPTVPRVRAFLHNHGASEWKNTLAVIAAWHQYNLPFKLTVIGEHYYHWHPNITYLKNISKDELVRLKNEHQFHIMASAYEGFGHTAWESLSCGAVLITSGFPPLDELTGAPDSLRVPAQTTYKAGIATAHGVSQMSVMKSVEACAQLSDEDCRGLGLKARESFLAMRSMFERRFGGLIEHITGLGHREPLDVKNLVDTPARIA